SFNFVGEIIGLDANRALDSRGAEIVVSVAAHVDQQNLAWACRLQLAREFGDLDSGHNAIRAMLPVERDAVRNESDHGEDDYEFDGMSGCLKAARDARNEIAEKISESAICECIRSGAQQIEAQELYERHFHAAR